MAFSRSAGAATMLQRHNIIEMLYTPIVREWQRIFQHSKCFKFFSCILPPAAAECVESVIMKSKIRNGRMHMLLGWSNQHTLYALSVDVSLAHDGKCNNIPFKEVKLKTNSDLVTL